MLECRGLTKSYSTKVLDDVDLFVAAGEIHALLGSNGAGKSTLCKLIAGTVEVDSGEIKVGGNVRYIPQHPYLVDELSVAENLFLDGLPSRRGVLNRSELTRQSKALLANIGLEHIDPELDVSRLGVGERQLLSIARALRESCSLLILDEPTAPLSPREVTLLFDRVRRLADSGAAILYVTHRMHEVHELCERFTVLRDGVVVGSDRVERVTDTEVVALLAGEAPTGAPGSARSPTGAVCLKLRGLSGSGYQDLSFELREGERLGIAGLVGSGRTEILRAIFGADPAQMGELVLAGVERECFTHPKQAVEAGIAMITEDRHQDGVLLSESIAVNVNLVDCPNSNGVVDDKTVANKAVGVVDDLAVSALSIDQPVTELSGGNQQKVAIGKWLDVGAKVYLFDEPTRGIDVRARQRVHALFLELSDQGCGQLIVSSDIDELMGVCDRILVIASGRIVAELKSDAWTKEEIVAAMFGKADGKVDSKVDIRVT